MAKQIQELSSLTCTQAFAYRGEDLPYPSNQPFNPSRKYPEYTGKISTEKNPVYDAVRNLFFSAGFDKDAYGTVAWSPLKNVIKPGDRVVIKPNLVTHFHPRHLSMDCMVTHGSVIRAVLDYACIALKGQGQLRIVDVPLQSADWQAIASYIGFDALKDYVKCNWSGIKFEIIDARLVHLLMDNTARIIKAKKLQGDPRGYVLIDLSRHSELVGIIKYKKKFRVSDYSERVDKHHNESCNEYLLAKSVIDADVIVNLPKLKTHEKAGVTLSLKNMIGINGDKSWLPHFRKGPPACGGDEYPGYTVKSTILSHLRSYLYPVLRRSPSFIWIPTKSIANKMKNRNNNHLNSKTASILSAGAWHGNDTIWRVILDINRALFYSDINGKLCAEPQRKYISLIDGWVGGEGNGPLNPDPVDSRVLICALNALAADIAATEIMGIDWRKLKVVTNAFKISEFPLALFDPEDVCLRADFVTEKKYRLSDGWRDCMESQL